VTWTRPRIALVACATVSALAMLYVGFYQIGWISHLACPGFGSGCESVAQASFARPLGLADGLLGAALCGLITAVAQLKGKEAAAALVLLAFANLFANVVGIFDMQKLGTFCLWCTLGAILSLPIAVLALFCARTSEGGGAAALPPIAPADRGEQH
jgi:uncharacterized membrane protein